MKIQKAEGKTYRAQLAPKIRSIDEKNRTIEFVASTEAVDRMGDIIRTGGWQFANYLKNPIMLWAHQSNQLPIGKCLALSIESNPPVLVQKIQFAEFPFASTVFSLYRDGYLNAVSVGFLPLENPKPIVSDTGEFTGYEFTSQELLELSSVCIPANASALARAIESGTLTADDAEKVFAPENLLNTEQLAASVGKLETAIAKLEINIQEFVEKRTLAATRKAEKPEAEITSVDQLCEALASGADAQVDELEKLFVVPDDKLGKWIEGA